MTDEQPTDHHCHRPPTITALDHARHLLDRHTGHGPCAAFLTALDYSSEVLGG